MLLNSTSAHQADGMNLNESIDKIPARVVYQCLQADEQYYEYDGPSGPQLYEDNLHVTALAESIHNSILNILSLAKVKASHTFAVSDYNECMKPLESFIKSVRSDTFELIDEGIFSAEVELFKLAKMNFGLKHQIGFLAQPQGVDANQNGFEVINEAIAQYPEYRNIRRTRKQKCDRMWNKLARLSVDLISSWGAFYCFRIELGMNYDRPEKYNLQLAVKCRNEFLKSARDSGLLPDGTQYIWFLDHHRQKGFFHHFYILCDCNYVQNMDYIIDSVGQFWVQKITNGMGCYLACHRMADYKFHRKAGIGVVSRNDASSMQRFYCGLSIMCARELYRCFYDSTATQTYDSGMLKCKNAALSRPLLDRNLISAPLVVVQPHYQQSFCVPMPNNFEACNQNIFGIQDPTASFPKNLPISVFFGYETYTGHLISWYPGMLCNGFLLVTGQSGSGKTNSLKQICSQLTDPNGGVPIWIFDPHNGLRDLGFTSVLLSGGVESKVGINPLKLYFEDFERRGLHDQISAVVDMVRRSAKNFGRRAEDILQMALQETYVSKGFSSADKPSSECKSPTFDDVTKLLNSWLNDPKRAESHRAIEGCLSVLRSVFGHPVFNRTDHFDIEKNIKENICFDISVLPESVRYVAVESLLRQVFNYLSQVGPITSSPTNDNERFRLFIVVDEAKLLTMTGGDPEAPDRMLNVLVSEGRKFGVGMVLVSQRFDHFSKEIRTNAAARLIHKTHDAKEIKLQAEQMQVQPKLLASLSGEGDCFFWNGLSNPHRIKMSPYSDSSGPPTSSNAI